MPAAPSISVLMPAKDEGHHIYENLVETARVFEDLGYPFEIVLIDDGSSDNTFEEALRAASEGRPIRLYKCQKNHGKGHALKSGFSVSRGDLIAFLDADLDLPPGQFKRLLRVMEEQGADIVIGSKRHPESVVNYPVRRKVLSQGYACLLLLLFGLPLKDTQSGIKLFRREPLSRIFPVVLCKQWAFDVELLANAHHLGYRIAEAPVELHFRREVRWGRVGLRTLFKTGLDTLAIFYRLRILHYYDRALMNRKVRRNPRPLGRGQGARMKISKSTSEVEESPPSKTGIFNGDGAASAEAEECGAKPDPSVPTGIGGGGRA